MRATKMVAVPKATLDNKQNSILSIVDDIHEETHIITKSIDCLNNKLQFLLRVEDSSRPLSSKGVVANNESSPLYIELNKIINQLYTIESQLRLLNDRLDG